MQGKRNTLQVNNFGKYTYLKCYRDIPKDSVSDGQERFRMEIFIGNQIVNFKIITDNVLKSKSFVLCSWSWGDVLMRCNVGVEGA